MSSCSQAGHQRGMGWEDLQWLLVNKVEFVHNFLRISGEPLRHAAHASRIAESRRLLGGRLLVPAADRADQRAGTGQGAARNSARFVIFVNLDGGQSHVDAWDLKSTSGRRRTEIKEVQPGVKWPAVSTPTWRNSGASSRSCDHSRRGTASTCARSTTCSRRTCSTRHCRKSCHLSVP